MGQPIELEKLRTTVGLETAYAGSIVTQRKHSSGKWNRRLKPVAAAAVLMIAAAVFFLNTPTVKAVELSQIYQAIATINNVCISRFTFGEAEPKQKEWISRGLNVNLFDTGEKFVLWDIPNKVMKTKHISSGSITIISLSEDILAKYKNHMAGSLGLVPFDHITDVPEDARWVKVTNEDIRLTIPTTEIYDLIWSETKDEHTRYRRWRIFVHTDTNLPERAEWYSKFKFEEKYKLDAFIVAKYLERSEIQHIIQNIFD